MKIVQKVKPFFKDKRGEMFQLLDKEAKYTSALLITCKKGAVRANHYHKKDTHYSYMISGKMEYYYKDIKSKASPKKVIVKKGEIVCTPPMTLHAMKFLEDSVFLALTTEPRNQNEYENDTMRVEIINP